MQWSLPSYNNHSCLHIKMEIQCQLSSTPCLHPRASIFKTIESWNCRIGWHRRRAVRTSTSIMLATTSSVSSMHACTHHTALHKPCRACLLARTPQRCTSPSTPACLHTHPCAAPALPPLPACTPLCCRPRRVAGLVQCRGMRARRQAWQVLCSAGVCVQAK